VQKSTQIIHFDLIIRFLGPSTPGATYILLTYHSMIRNLILVAFVAGIFTLPGSYCLAQIASAPPELNPVTPFFNTLSVNDGLPTNVIAAVAEDDHKFIWVGTGNGLSRYDGYRFQTFRKGEHLSTLPSNQISSLLSDDGFVWVGTWNGLCRVNTTTLEVTRVDLGAHHIVRALYKDSDNTIWIGTTTALLHYDKNDSRFTAYTSQNSKLSHNTIRSVYRDTRGDLWVGTYDKLNRLRKGTSEFTQYDLKGNHKPSMKNNLIMDVKPVSHNVDSLLWVGTETGLALLNTNTGGYKLFNEQNNFSNEVIKTIYVDNENKVWLGTDFGLQVFDPLTAKNSTLFHNPQVAYSVANNVIWQIFEDSGGVIWFVTSNGISKMNKHRNVYDYHEVSYQIEDQTIGNQVKATLVARNGALWLATLHGVVRIDPRTRKSRVFDTNGDANSRILFNNVFALEEDNLGRIWIGTAGGINVWSEREQKMYALPSDLQNGLTSNYIAKFTRASDGSFWVSAWEGGLFRIDGNFEDPSSLHFQLMGDFGSEKNAAGDNAIWVVKDNELYRIDLVLSKSTAIEAFHDASKRRDINAIYFSSKGKLWGATLAGLIEYDPTTDKAVYHPITTGSQINFSSVMEDVDGNIWAAGTSSLVKFMPTENRFELFPLDNGLPLKSFFNGCTSQGLNGEIIFGGDNGYITVYPERAQPDNYKPPVYITRIRINNSDDDIEDSGSTAFVSDLTLDYSQRSVTFEFASLHYWFPSMNVYAYKLDGFDNTWRISSGEMNFATYSNLPAGEYTFHVRGSNNHAVWSDQEATVTLRVKPPLFLSTGFIIVYVALALLAVYLSLRAYSARLHLKNELKIIRMEKDHAEEIAQTKQQFFTNISHELRTPISLIVPPIHQVFKNGTLDEESRRLISLAEKNSVRLLRLVDQILDFRKMENGSLPLRVTSFELVKFCRDVYDLFADQASRKDIDFTFFNTDQVCRIWGDAEKVETILFNLLSNAFKFTPKGGTIGVMVEVQPSSYTYPNGSVNVSVRDSGVGIPFEEQSKIFDRFYQSSSTSQMGSGYGIGLNLASEYAKLHHGELSFTSEPGKGTAFMMVLPLSNSHFPVDTIHDDVEINLLASRSTTTSEKVYRFDLQSDKPLVLIVENNVDIIDFIRITLEDRYNFIVAENGEEGLSKAVSFLPEVIVSDIMMPVMDGLTLCKKIKENPSTSHISIILLSAKQLSEQKVEGIRLGADSYLTKPFEIELLEAHIDQLIRRNRELKGYFRNELQLTDGKPQSNGDEKFIERVMSIIEANISNPDFGVEMLCHDIGMSSTHLYRKLKSITHFSANEIIKKYRIKKASLLLRSKEGNISEIMYNVGFSNLSYFSKCFKKEYGLSPKDYQQQVGVSSIEIDRKLDLELGKGSLN
jgi:signal transduction histidine kinase/ligand-binding sensor domain-containing protein/CheY-like chemotaxis protein/AraC-like DNA-binding protein